MLPSHAQSKSSRPHEPRHGGRRTVKHLALEKISKKSLYLLVRLVGAIRVSDLSLQVILLLSDEVLA